MKTILHLLLFWTLVALTAIAAPSASSSGRADVLAAPDEVPSRRIPSPVQATVVRNVRAPACMQGVPASKQRPSVYPIDGYTLVTPKENLTNYAVRKDWGDDHFVSGPHYLAYGHKMDPLAAFECQYTCNGDDNCRAYFVLYVDVDTDQEYAGCTLYDDMLHPSVLVPGVNTTIGGGAYDKLCPQ